MTELQSALSHVSLGTNNFAAAAAFYDKVLATLGIKRTMDLSEHNAIAYGRAYPEFWIQSPINGQPAQTANGTHVAFLAENPAQVDAFYAAHTTVPNTTAASSATWTATKSKRWPGTSSEAHPLAQRTATQLVYTQNTKHIYKEVNMLTKVFQSGNSQAVRIPLDYRFNTDTVEIFRADNGDIILRPARLSGEAFLDLFSGFDDDFIAALADRDDDPPPERDSL